MPRFAALAVILAVMAVAQAAPALAGSVELRNCTHSMASVSAYSLLDRVKQEPASTAEISPNQTGRLQCVTSGCDLKIVVHHPVRQTVETDYVTVIDSACLTVVALGPIVEARVTAGPCSC